MSGIISKKIEKDPVVERFQQAMSKIDALSFQYSQLISFTNSLQEKFLSLEENMKNISSILTSLSKKSTESASIVVSHINSSSSSHDALKSDNVFVKKEIADLKSLIPSLHSNLKNVNDQLQAYTPKEQFIQLKSLVSLLENHIADNDRMFVSWEKEFNNSVNCIASTSQRHDEDVRSLKNQILDLQNYIKVLENKYIEADSRNSSLINSLRSEMLEKMDAKIALIPKPVIPLLDDAKKHMEEKLQPVVFDSKNAHLRSENNEYKITILEKKVEQLQLLLNKIKLTG
jgi:predicted  nucleic acid-binding Zn-ribbon protein